MIWDRYHNLNQLNDVFKGVTAYNWKTGKKVDVAAKFHKRSLKPSEADDTSESECVSDDEEESDDRVIEVKVLDIIKKNPNAYVVSL